MKQPDWMFDEAWIFDQSRNSGVDFADPQQVALYDAKSGTSPAALNALLDELGVSTGHTLIDFGAGTGGLALEAAKRCQRVIAVDLSTTMLAYLAQKAQALDLRNVECVQQGFLTYTHLGEPVDFIYTRNALHHLPDFWKAQALWQMHRILKPGGILCLQDLVFSFAPAEAAARIDAWLAAAPPDPAQGWARPELAAHVREEYSPYSWLLEAMLERTGFCIHKASYSDSRIFANYVCVRVDTPAPA
jgi:ubiquinone/menaquinone biosynthesis C-methylase UbiE